MKPISLLISVLLIVVVAQGQRKKRAPVAKEPVINYSFNRIFCGQLDTFYTRLNRLEKTKKGIVSVVQIGDSHTQPDFISSVVREKLQQQFGNAGRGLVFPYQLAQSNAPIDILSSSQISWSFNRVAHPEINLLSGVSGFVIENTATSSGFTIQLKDKSAAPQQFNRLRLYFEKDSNTNCTIIASTETTDVKTADYIKLKNPTSSFEFNYTGNNSTFRFFGASLETGQPGVLYHNIGVNGAKYEHYNQAPLFWQQLKELKADLYIVSLGTNEAQALDFDAAVFEQQMNDFVNHIKNISPEADLLITTSADSFKKGVANLTQRDLNNFITRYCEKNSIPIWDLYRITNGYGASKRWLQKGYMNKDGVHFLSAGYQIHGQLLRDCLMTGYQKYFGKKY